MLKNVSQAGWLANERFQKKTTLRNLTWVELSMKEPQPLKIQISEVEEHKSEEISIGRDLKLKRYLSEESQFEESRLEEVLIWRALDLNRKLEKSRFEYISIRRDFNLKKALFEEISVWRDPVLKKYKSQEIASWRDVRWEKPWFREVSTWRNLRLKKPHVEDISVWGELHLKEVWNPGRLGSEKYRFEKQKKTQTWRDLTFKRSPFEEL